MSRPNKPWFRKSNKRWYVWHDGRQRNLGPDREAAFQEFHRLMAEGESKPSISSKHLTVIELADHFLEWVHRNRSPDTYEWYRYRLARLCSLHGELAATDLRPYHVESWVNQYALSVVLIWIAFLSL